MKFRLGTRKSKLALWQAEMVQSELRDIGVECEIVEIESFGDKVQDIPLHKLGDKGVFTKALDIALLEGNIDLAVHSLKDVPTELEEGLVLASVPVREDPRDVLVSPLSARTDQSRIVATGSIRRKAFWMNKYPDHEVTGLRGNVPTRLKKIDESNWIGGVFAFAGLIRLGLDDRVSEVLEWMIPAPAQGAVGIVSRNEIEIIRILQQIENTDVRTCVEVERSFLNRLEAGCSSPVGALATIFREQLSFKGAVLSPGGKNKLSLDRTVTIPSDPAALGRKLAEELIKKGALQLMEKGDL
ncbi:hydroxymethylbilane synthase [Balneola sp. MJW-20]|uniref:hydroxymethylbilane synthase n=1 Tax=Gracilimonas aurantiaca TaxID=3234185 RepID=UPI0034652E59